MRTKWAGPVFAVSILLLSSSCNSFDKHFKFNLVIPRDFRGDIELVKDDSFKWEPGKVYTLKAVDGKVSFPADAINDAIVPIELRDTTGKALCHEYESKSGEPAITGRVYKNNKQYLQISLAP